MYGGRRSARRVKFSKVSVLEFNRVLGRTVVPERGGFALGLGDQLLAQRELSVREYEGGLERVPHSPEMVPESGRRALLELEPSDPAAKAEMRDAESRKRCVCDADCLCKDRSCPCIKEGIQCYDDGSSGCGCRKRACRNPAGIYRFNEEEIYYARRNKLQEVEQRQNRTRELYGDAWRL